MAATSARSPAMAHSEDREEAILAELARIPIGRPLTRHQAHRIAEVEASVAAGERGRATEEVIAAARERLRV